MKPVTQTSLHVDAGAIAVMEGADGLGQVITKRAMEESIARAKKHGVNAEPVVEIKTPQIVDQATIGDLLFAVVALAAQHGVDPEQAMRSRARAYKESLSRSE